MIAILLSGMLMLAAESAAVPGADELVARSIAYHDPQGQWPALAATLVIEEERPDAQPRHVRVDLDLGQGIFHYDLRDGDLRLTRSARQQEFTATLNGESSISAEEADQYRLTPAHVESYRNYYLYLYGMPMKLEDPGTHVDPQVEVEEFEDQEVWSVRVTYDEAVGTHVWYFYFDPQDTRLVGCRFHKDEAAQDGEWIVFSGETEGKGLRLPTRRAWYVNQTGEHLGTDVLKSIE